jgi:DNA polymerase
VLIGEAPGQRETATGRPFIGPSGALLEGWWRDVGLRRRDFYITNVHKYQPPGNHIEKVPKAELAESMNELRTELTALRDPWLIIPTGNVALRALTGRRNITDWRGSVIGCMAGDRVLKCIPTIHPAATFRSPKLTARCRVDWARIAREARTPFATPAPDRETHLNPTLADVMRFFARAVRAPALSIDIETPRKRTAELVRMTKKGKPVYKKIDGERRITLVGFSLGPQGPAIAIPTTLAYWNDAETLDTVWQVIREMCALPCEKVLQNGMFDTWWLARHNVTVTNFVWDTLAMHHCLDPFEDHDLATMASLYTTQPFWKHQGKDNDEDEDDPTTEGFTDYQSYNCIDTCVTYELFTIFREMLSVRGLLDFYRSNYTNLLEPLRALSLHGIVADVEEMSRRRAVAQARCNEIKEALNTIAEESICGAKSISNKKLQHFLYDTLKLRPKMLHGKVTTNEVALRKLFDETRVGKPDAHNALALLIEYRRAFALVGQLKVEGIDADHRLRCQYKFTTVFNRLSSSKNPFGTGRNLQNSDHETLDLYQADAGCLLLECDLSQAEDRVVKALAYGHTHNEALIERARSAPWENDEHKRAAVSIFKVPFDRVTKDQRYLGKRTRHATNYDMHGKTMSEQLIKEGYAYDAIECQSMIDTLRSDDPDIGEWQKRTRMELIKTRQLDNSWGRIWRFDAMRMDDELFRKAYACRPQSEVGMLLNQWGLIPLYHFIKANRLRSRINLQVHDALKVSVTPDEAFMVVMFLRSTLQRPRSYKGVPLTIPCEFKLGFNVAGSHEFKRFDAAEFQHVVNDMEKELR